MYGFLVGALAVIGGLVLVFAVVLTIALWWAGREDKRDRKRRAQRESEDERIRDIATEATQPRISGLEQHLKKCCDEIKAEVTKAVVAETSRFLHVEVPRMIDNAFAGRDMQGAFVKRAREDDAQRTVSIPTDARVREIVGAMLMDEALKAPMRPAQAPRRRRP